MFMPRIYKGTNEGIIYKCDQCEYVLTLIITLQLHQHRCFLSSAYSFQCFHRRFTAFSTLNAGAGYFSGLIDNLSIEGWTASYKTYYHFKEFTLLFTALSRVCIWLCVRRRLVTAASLSQTIGVSVVKRKSAPSPICMPATWVLLPRPVK